MDVAVSDKKAAAAYIKVYWLDLVSFRLVRSGPVYRGLVLPDADTFMLGCLDGSLAKEDSVDLLNILDRSALHVGRIVVSASDAGGQIGVVTGVTTVLDLAHLNYRGKATKVIRGVSPSGVRRVRTFNLGDYVVSGTWLGRVVAVSLNVDVMFDDGAVCKVTKVESKDLRSVNPEEYYRTQMNTLFYPGRHVVAGDSAAVFKEAQWLNGHWKPGREIGTVVTVEMAGVLVYWIASAQHGTKQQLVRELAPPAYQSSPDTLTFFCSSFDCCWALSDRCFLADASIPQQHTSSSPAQSALQPTMLVNKTRTTVDVLWQDGTRQHGAPSTSLAPFTYMNEPEVFPGQYVVDNAPTDDIIDVTEDDVTGAGASGSTTRRVGFVRCLNSKDHTVDVSWFKDPDSWEVECNDTVSAYDLVRDPDHSVFYGDVVVRLPWYITGDTPLAQKKCVPADLSWVGRVVDLHDGHVHVKWGDGSTSTVLPHEIGIANKDNYAQLLTEMADWPEFLDNAPQELDADNEENQQHNSTDARNVEGGMVEISDSSVIKLGGPNTNMQNVEVTTHVTTGSHEDPNVGFIVTEDGFAVVARNDASGDDDDDSAEDEVVIKARYATGADDPLKFAHFDVVQSPLDHHYFDTMDQGSNCGKKWVKTVQKEWKILKNSLPDNIYVRAFEDRMDLLRVVMVGASGTPYHNGLFFFDMQLPPSYPVMPPQLYYHSFGLRLNPNLYESGTVCLSLLNTFGGEGMEVWSPGRSSLLQVVISLQALVLNDQPYYNEASYGDLVDTPVGRRNALHYSEKAFLLTLRTTLHQLRRPAKGFEQFVMNHFRQRGRYMLETCQAYLHGCVPADHGGMKILSSTGFRIALANVVPRLAAVFSEIGAEGCDEYLLTSVATSP